MAYLFFADFCVCLNPLTCSLSPWKPLSVLRESAASLLCSRMCCIFFLDPIPESGPTVFVFLYLTDSPLGAATDFASSIKVTDCRIHWLSQAHPGDARIRPRGAASFRVGGGTGSRGRGSLFLKNYLFTGKSRGYGDADITGEVGGWRRNGPFEAGDQRQGWDLGDVTRGAVTCRGRGLCRVRSGATAALLCPGPRGAGMAGGFWGSWGRWRASSLSTSEGTGARGTLSPGGN